MMARTKTLGANLPVPQNREDAATAIREIGDTNRQIARIELDLNDQVAKLKEAAEQQAGPLKDIVKARTEGLKLWAEANRDSLTGGGKVKFADLGTGKISWRLRPAKVSLRGRVEEIVAKLKALGLHRFIRVSEEVNKEAMLADREAARAVTGVTIASEGEDFVIEPFEADLAQQPAA
jgi:phage host-nuclease inhibitor protein Gam